MLPSSPLVALRTQNEYPGRTFLNFWDLTQAQVHLSSSVHKVFLLCHQAHLGGLDLEEKAY